jgi:hypothetical protein
MWDNMETSLCSLTYSMSYFFVTEGHVPMYNRSGIASKSIFLVLIITFLLAALILSFSFLPTTIDTPGAIDPECTHRVLMSEDVCWHDGKRYTYDEWMKIQADENILGDP